MVLAILNTYPLLVSQNLVFRSKEIAVSGSIKVMESALSGLQELTQSNVSAALSGLEESGVSRILVTNKSGQVLYDTRTQESAVGQYVFYTEIAEALNGNDSFYSAFDGEAFLSRGAAPVVYRSRIIGTVYAYQYDLQQGTLLKNLENNLMAISVVVAVVVIGFSVLFSRMFTQRISQLLQAIRQVREGSYGHRAQMKGTDEIAQLAAEFNSLTGRLQITEEARRRFVSDASHEMKTPLAGIRLLTDSILQTKDIDPDTTREFVADIGDEARRLERITEDLLRLSRLDSGTQEESVRVWTGEVLKRVSRMLQPVAHQREVTLTWQADPAAVVLATEGDIHQILYNLMENAVKYTPAGGFVHTDVSVKGEQVIITVEDNGIGISPEDMPHIFERFYRVDKARSRLIGGTGLGLSIVGETVQRRGGTVEVAARAGGGTVFTVCFAQDKEKSV